MYPTLIQFEHRGQTLLSVRGKNVSYISITPEEQGKTLAHALGCPLLLRHGDLSELTSLEAAYKVQDEWADRNGATDCPEGFNIIG